MADDLSLRKLILDESWAYKVSVLADLVARRIAPIVQDVSGLNLSQWRVIAAVADQPGRTASQVVDLTPMDKGIVSRAVRTLVERDLIERRSSKQDGRLSHLYMTVEGDRLYQKIIEALARSGASGDRTGSAEEQAQLISTLQSFIETYADQVE